MASGTTYGDMANEYRIPPLVVFLAGVLPAGFAALTFVGHTVMGATSGQPATTTGFFAFHLALLLVGVSLMYIGLLRGVEAAVARAT